LADKSLPETLDPRIVENAALHRRITELEAEVDDLKRHLKNVQRWHKNATLMRQAQAQQWAQAQQNLQAQNLYQAQAQGQLNSWHDCTCVPGRAAAFGVLSQGDN
jgi:predicted nuclease with TOPRIM domain